MKLVVFALLFFFALGVHALCTGDRLVYDDIQDGTCSRIVGDLVLDDVPDIQFLDFVGNVSEITGSLTIRSMNLIENFDGFDSLTKIGKSLIIESNNFLVSTRGMPNLLSVGENFVLKDNIVLELVDGIIIASIGGDVEISRNPVLRNIDGLIDVVEVPGSVTVQGNSALVHLNGMRELASVAGDFVLRNNTGLEVVSLMMLEMVGGELIVEEQEEIYFPVLEAVGSLIVQGNSGLKTLDGFRVLKDISEDIMIQNNDDLRDISALSSVTSISGDFSIIGNAVLGNLKGIENIRGFGSSTFIGAFFCTDELSNFTSSTTATVNCDCSCPTTSNGICDVDSICRCDIEWTGDDCRNCSERFSGETCSECSERFSGASCDSCSLRFSGEDCNDCSTRFAGEECMECSAKYDGELCDGCAFGYLGENCDEGCNSECADAKDLCLCEICLQDDSCEVGIAGTIDAVEPFIISGIEVDFSGRNSEFKKQVQLINGTTFNMQDSQVRFSDGLTVSSSTIQLTLDNVFTISGDDCFNIDDNSVIEVTITQAQVNASNDFEIAAYDCINGNLIDRISFSMETECGPFYTDTGFNLFVSFGTRCNDPDESDTDTPSLASHLLALISTVAVFACF